MKRCPQCESTFSDTELFCERDGTRLLREQAYGNDDEPELDDQQISPADLKVTQRSSGQEWTSIALVVVMAVAGIAIGLVLFLVYQERARRSATQNAVEPSAKGVVQQQIPRPAPLASASPTAEPSPSPSVTTSPATPTESPRLELSSSPISTAAAGKRGQVAIRLVNGTSVEADEVWETQEGIWYRRGGVVTLLDRAQVKSIETPTPTPSRPTASPTASP
jgi:hypothetical protein